ncbi:MAG: hypothetical protein KA282_00215, partial [Clostridia bacterium]|nr:hypothetical protein [Clostridia bacterium]
DSKHALEPIQSLKTEKPEVLTGASPTLKDLMEAAERKIIVEKYEKLRSSYKVAKELGISQSQASQKIRKYIGDQRF